MDSGEPEAKRIEEEMETDELTETMDVLLIENCPQLQDPELGGMHLAEIKYVLNQPFGFLYEQRGDTVHITLRFTSPMCPVGFELAEASAHFIFEQKETILKELNEVGFSVKDLNLEVVDFASADEVNKHIQEIKKDPKKGGTSL